MISIRTCGMLDVSFAGALLPLPASRKTRALLGYLVLSGTSHRRERLCELFWEVPDDPRGSLRWSLSKLRPVLNAGGVERLRADRERVEVSTEALLVDFFELRAAAEGAHAGLESLAQLWQRAGEALLEGCDLPKQADFSAWLNQQRREAIRLRIQLARRLARAEKVSAEDAQAWAQRWLMDAPTDPHAAQQVVAAKRRLGLEQEALILARDLEQTFREAGLPLPDFTDRSPAVGFTPPLETAQSPAPRQTVRFVQAGNQTSLAWASMGSVSNPPLLITANWLSHLELDWDAPFWMPLFRDLAKNFHIVRYDGRGYGVSTWDAPDIGLEAFVADLRTVADAAGLERFALLGISPGAAVSIEFAARHPERVSHLILCGSYVAGWRHIESAEEAREREAILLLAEAGWARNNRTYRTLFSHGFLPNATAAEKRWFDDFQRRTTSAKNAMRLLDAFTSFDVRERLPQLTTPTLVIHSRGDTRVPVATARETAKQIPGAELLELASNNHLLLGREPAAADFLRAVRRFLK